MSLGSVVLAILAGCLLPSTDGLSSGGGVDGGLDVGCVDCLDGALPDVATDTGKDAADSAPAAFCAGLSPKPIFCEDFDSAASFSAQFTNVHQTKLASLSADSAAFTSPPRSLLAQLPSSSSNSDFAFLTRVFTGSPTELDFAFDLRIDGLVAGEASVVADLIVGEGTPSEHEMAVVAIDGDLFFEESFPTDASRVFNEAQILSGTLPKGTWIRIRMLLSLKTHQAQAFIDGALAKTFALDPGWAAGLPQIDLGYSYVSKQSSPWSAHFDNVVYDAK